MIKKYLYEATDEPAVITYDDIENTISLHKESQALDILITKHASYTTKNGVKVARLHRDKATNLVKKFKKEIIERGMKDGICKAM